MRLDRGRPEIRSKSYSNQLLIDFFDPNSAVQSIVATISIRNPGIYIENRSILSKIDRFYRKSVELYRKFVEFDRKRSFWFQLVLYKIYLVFLEPRKKQSRNQ